MANVIIKYFDIKEYNIDVLKQFSNIIPLRFEKCKNYTNEKMKLQCILAGILIYKNLGNIESKLKYNKYGKAILDDKNFFNISHTGDYVLFVKDDNKIGIDIERINDRNLNVINYAFNNKEIELINGDIKELTKLWTIKEATYKASGIDKYLDFKNIDTSNKTEVKYNNETYNIISKEFGNCFISVSSINKYDDIQLIKESI